MINYIVEGISLKGMSPREEATPPLYISMNKSLFINREEETFPW